jgi:hypothetical protein
MCRIQPRQIEQLVGIRLTGEEIGLVQNARMEQRVVAEFSTHGREAMPHPKLCLWKVGPDRRPLSLPGVLLGFRACLRRPVHHDVPACGNIG